MKKNKRQKISQNSLKRSNSRKSGSLCTEKDDKRLKRAESSSNEDQKAWVTCPICSKNIRFHRMDFHLDFECSAMKSSSTESAGSIKIQKTIESYDHRTESLDTSMPSFYALELKNSKFRSFFSRNLPSGYSIIARFNATELAGTRELLLCTNIPIVESSDFNVFYKDIFCHYFDDMENFYRNMPLLKSHLQKSIRRCSPKLAVLTAWHMSRMPDPKVFTANRKSDNLKLSPSEALYGLNQLVRRLPIIMIEDVILHRDFPVLTWLMVYISRLQSTKYFYSCKIIESKSWYYIRKWIFGLVCWLAECPIKDPHHDDSFIQREYLELCDISNAANEKYKCSYVDSKSKTFWETFASDEKYRDLLLSMEIRRSFGGMKGDKEMLIRSETIWFNRLSRYQTLKEGHEPLYPLSDIFKHIGFLERGILDISGTRCKFLKPTEMHPSAVDFHISQVSLSLMQWIISHFHSDSLSKEHAELIEKYFIHLSHDAQLNLINSLIWNFSSSVTKKTAISWKSNVLIETEQPTDLKKLWGIIENEFTSHANIYMKSQH